MFELLLAIHVGLAVDGNWFNSIRVSISLLNRNDTCTGSPGQSSVTYLVAGNFVEGWHQPIAYGNPSFTLSNTVSSQVPRQSSSGVTASTSCDQVEKAACEPADCPDSQAGVCPLCRVVDVRLQVV